MNFKHLQDEFPSLYVCLLPSQIQNQYLVEGKDIVVKYSLFNVGDATAVGVKLAEMGFPSDAFDMVGGAMKVGHRLLNKNALHPKPSGP